MPRSVSREVMNVPGEAESPGSSNRLSMSEDETPGWRKGVQGFLGLEEGAQWGVSQRMRYGSSTEKRAQQQRPFPPDHTGF